MDLGIQRQRNLVHSKKVHNVGDIRLGKIWEVGSIQGDRWEEGRLEGGGGICTVHWICYRAKI